MIPTIFFQVLFGVFAGLVLAQSARVIVRAHQGNFWQCRALYVAMAFGAIVVCPSSLYFYLVHPDWSWMYLVDPSRMPAPVLFLLLLFDMAALCGGFALGYRFVRTGKFWHLIGAIGVLALLSALLFGLLRRRLLYYGTFAAFHTGSGLVSIGQVKLGYALVVVSAAALGGLAHTGYQLFLAGRRIS